MTLHHRKLIFESLDNSTGKTCSTNYYCDTKENPSGLCPLSCLYICYNCRFLSFPDVLPPLPPNFATPTVPIPQSQDRHAISIFLIVLFSFLATSFFIFSFFVVHKFRNSRNLQQLRQQQEVEEEEVFTDIVDEDHGPMLDHPIWYIRTVGLQPSVISAITICKYKKGEGLVEGTTCSVCLSEFQEDETLRILPKCSHAFHTPCIDTWLRSHTNCPMCRAGIVSTTAAATPSPEQNSGQRHEGETSLGISENATELSIEIENGGDSVDLSTTDISGNSKEDVGPGNGGELSEFYALRRSASIESLSTASILTGASDIANSSRDQSTDQYSSEESIEVNATKMGSLSFDGNASTAGNNASLFLNRVMQKGHMRSPS